MLERMKAQKKICVASNGRTCNVHNALKATGLFDLFGENTIYSAEQVVHPKPAPDLIHYAAAQMGVTKMSRVIHIEDTARGAQAGITAGAFSIGFTGFSHNPEKTRQELSAIGTRHIFHDWASFERFVMG